MGRLDASARRWRAALSERTVIRLHYISLLAAFAAVLWYTRRQWFTEDDWEFIHRLIPGADKLGLFVPHNEHWSTLPLLVYRLLFAMVGLRSYVPYLVVLLALHVVAAHLMWRLMLRAGAEVLLATVVTGVFLVLGSGAENLDWAFQIGFVGALAAGLGMVVAVQEGGRGRLLAAWVLGVAAVMCSGLGPLMVLAATLTALLMFGWRRAALVAAVPAAVFAAWWLSVGRHPPTPPLPRGPLSSIPDYVVTGITSAAANITGLRFVGALLLVPLALWLVVSVRTAPRHAAVVALAATTLPFFLLVGFGRIGLGVAESTTSRYVYISAVLLLPAAAVAATQLGRRHVLLAGLIALAVAWAGVHNARALATAVTSVTGVREHAEARVLAAARLVHGTAIVFAGQPEPATAPDLSWNDLVYLVDSHDLPATSPVDLLPIDTVSVEANLQMAFSGAPLLPAATAHIQSRPNAVVSPVSLGCVSVLAAGTGSGPSVQLVFDAPASLAIRAAAGSLVTAHLYSSLPSRIESPPHQVTVDSSGTVYLLLSLPGGAPLVDLPRSGATLCGVAG